MRLETRLASQSNESLFKKRLEDVLMHREEVVKSVRHCTWYKVCTNSTRPTNLISSYHSFEELISKQEHYVTETLLSIFPSKVVQNFAGNESSLYIMQVVLFMPWKQECMFLLTVYLARTLSLLSSKHSEIFRYVPEAYVEALLDLFQVL